MNVEKTMLKTCENHQKSHPKSMPKPSKNHKKSMRKKGRFLEAPPEIPRKARTPPGSHKHIQVNKTHKASEESPHELGACRETNLEHLTRLGRLRAWSGYIKPWPSPGLPADRSPGAGSWPDGAPPWPGPRHLGTIFQQLVSIFRFPRFNFQFQV